METNTNLDEFGAVTAAGAYALGASAISGQTIGDPFSVASFAESHGVRAESDKGSRTTRIVGAVSERDRYLLMGFAPIGWRFVFETWPAPARA